MVGFGPPQQAGKSTANKTPVDARSPVEKTSQPVVPAAAGELPHDAFSQFPPLSPQNQASLQKVDGDRKMNFPLSPYVLARIREKHGFNFFNENIFPSIRLLHADPVVFEVEDFFTPQECDTYVKMSTESQSGRRKGGFKSMELRSVTTSSQSQFQQQRTSTTWFHHYASAPELLAKASALLGVKDYRLWEEPQTVRYRPGERFNWHLDALPPAETGASKGGQRTATVLVYLTNMDVNAGGATAFRDLGPLRVRPKKGKCLVFFPSFGGEAGCPFDLRTLHAGEVVGEVAGKGKASKAKYIAQLWCHKKPYPPSVPVGSSHEAAEECIADYFRRWRGK
ncbi:unnamed protein product [Ascophyllum nodosum]